MLNHIKASFKKTFTSGLLVGITVKDTLSFVSADRAYDWKKGVEANIKKGVLNYELSDFTIL